MLRTTAILNKKSKYKTKPKPKRNNMSKGIWDESSEAVLKRGLNSMTKMCDVLSTQNETLNKDIEKLKNKIARMKDKLIENGVQE